MYLQPFVQLTTRQSFGHVREFKSLTFAGNMKNDWTILQEKFTERFGNELEIADILFLIGVQELGKFGKKFKKDDKVNLMHIAVCTLLEPYGYYSYEGRDKDGWPHWKLNEELPPLDSKQQNRLINEAVIDYFKKTGFIG